MSHSSPEEHITLEEPKATPDDANASRPSDVAPDVDTSSRQHENLSDGIATSRSSFKYKSSHPEDLIILYKNDPRKTRSAFINESSMLGFLSMVEPTKVDVDLSEEGWILVMQEERNQFQRNDIWDLVPNPADKSDIGTKWVLRNKLNKQGEG